MPGRRCRAGAASGPRRALPGRWRPHGRAGPVPGRVRRRHPGARRPAVRPGTGRPVTAESPAWPSIARLREVTQPPAIRGRRNAEHWTGDLYMRRISPYLTRVLLRAGLSANAVTALMIVTGSASGFALLIPGLWGAVLAVLLTQLQMLLDASDGEVARWRGTSSPLGIFLDRVGHYLAESLIPIALGVRAAGGLDDLADGGYGWTTLGALLAVVIVLN